jgi:hypothetical protein
MRNVFAFQFRIQRCKKEQLNLAIDQWIDNNILRRVENGASITRADAVRSLTWNADGQELERTMYFPPDTRNKYIEWQTTIERRHNQGAIDFRILVGAQSVADLYAPADISIGKPGLVDIIIDAYECTIDGIRLTRNVRAIDSNSVEGLSNQISDPNRKVPVVVVSRTIRNMILVDTPKLAGFVGGMCLIYELSDIAASNLFNERVGRPLSCYGGAMRLYWPGELGREPHFNRYWSWLNLERHQDRCLFQLRSQVFYNFSLRSGIDQESIKIIDKAEKAKREAEIELIRSRIKEDEKSVEGEFIHWMDSQLEEKDKTDTENYSLKQQLEQLRDALKQKTKSPDEAEEIEDVESALRVASGYFNEQSIVLLPSAVESAQESEYVEPLRVFKVLMEIYLTSVLYHENTPGLDFGTSVRACSGGCEYSDDVSGTARTKYKNDYEFTYKGEKITAGPHAGTGRDSSNTCFRIYWYVDRAERKFIICHVGIHLRDDTK